MEGDHPSVLGPSGAHVEPDRESGVERGLQGDTRAGRLVHHLEQDQLRAGGAQHTGELTEGVGQFVVSRNGVRVEPVGPL